MKISTFLLSLICLAGSSLVIRAQDPGAEQDAEAAREKLLKAANQIDMIETNSETTKAALDDMKTELAQLKDENAALKQQLAALQTALDDEKAAQDKKQKVLLDTVAGMVAAAKSSPPHKSSGKKKDATASTNTAPVPIKTPDGETAAVGTADAPPAVPDATPPVTNQGSTTDAEPDTSAPKTQKGYSHVVESGETLTLICAAFRQQGVKVTVAEIQKANGLTDKSVLRVGQKLFIPKPEPNP